jgi:hypothetical protein
MEKTIMSNSTNKPVTQTRIKELLECYGSASAAWPEAERRAALNLLAGYPELRTLRDKIQTLDDVLAEYRALEDNTADEHSVQALQQRIMAQLPDQEAPDDHFSHATRPVVHSHRLGLWTGSIAASALIAILSLNVIQQTHSPTPASDVPQAAEIASNEFSQWAWEDITGESLVPDAETENDPRTLVALLALEFPAE